MKKREKYSAAAYVRLSSEDGDKEESNSVVNQKKLLKDYAVEHGFKLHDFYVDDGYTGRNFDRPGFQRMLKDMEAGEVNCVIVKDLSRLGRNLGWTTLYIDEIFPQYGVRLIGVTDGVDSEKSEDSMMVAMRNLFNDQYSRDISKKIASSLKIKQENGEFIGAFACYGYKKSAQNKNKLVIDEFAAAIVRRIFGWYVEGMGKTKIAKRLNEECIPCPSEYKQINGLNYKNCNRMPSTTYWTYSTIDAILKNEIYIGNMVQGKKHQKLKGRQILTDKKEWVRVKSTHEPIIKPAVWEKAQRLLGEKQRDMNLEMNRNIFAGYVKCGDCGRAMAKNGWKRKDGSITYSFYCGSYKRYGKGHCSAHTMPFKALEEIVLDDLKTIIQSVEDLQEFIRSQSFTVSDSRKTAAEELRKRKESLKKVKADKKQLYMDFRNDYISEEEYFAYRKDYLKKEDLFKKEIEILEKTSKKDVQDIFANPWLRRLLKLGNVETLDRSVIVEMIDRILVYEGHRIKIIYNFGNEPEHLFSDVYYTKPENF